AEDVGSLRSPDAIDAVLQKLAALLGMFPGYAQIHAVYLSCELWSVENGLLTPTLKIKRSELEKHFVQEIKELYRGHVLVE
ncbi:MAG: long-chain fatty acid--CoA ligase, partial [Halobacteria archaeon]|nr:long-chain fatty acid--CoA ligase [Halobacteria archaeon]